MWVNINYCRFSQKEHTHRVINRENTPWVPTTSFFPTFENRKDTFIQKYQILLDHQEMLENRIYGKTNKSTIYCFSYQVLSVERWFIRPIDLLKHTISLYLIHLYSKYHRWSNRGQYPKAINGFPVFIRRPATNNAFSKPSCSPSDRPSQESKNSRVWVSRNRSRSRTCIKTKS